IFQFFKKYVVGMCWPTSDRDYLLNLSNSVTLAVLTCLQTGYGGLLLAIRVQHRRPPQGRQTTPLTGSHPPCCPAELDASTTCRRFDQMAVAGLCTPTCTLMVRCRIVRR